MKKYIGPNGEKMVSMRLSEIPPISEERLAEIDAIRDEDIDYSDIPDLADDEEFWEGAIVGWDNFVKWHKEQESSPKKIHLTMRLDENIVDYFKRRGRGYQSRMNAVLRAYVEAQMRAEAKKVK